MDDNLSGVLIVTVSMIGMVWLRYLKTFGRDRGLNAQENAMMTQMAQTALRLEQRVASLEQILVSKFWTKKCRPGVANPIPFTRQDNV